MVFIFAVFSFLASYPAIIVTIYPIVVYITTVTSVLPFYQLLFTVGSNNFGCRFDHSYANYDAKFTIAICLVALFHRVKIWLLFLLLLLLPLLFLPFTG